jgi:hypothetical protein
MARSLPCVFAAEVEVPSRTEQRTISLVRAMHHRNTRNRTISNKSKPPPIYILDSFWLPTLSEYCESVECI